MTDASTPAGTAPAPAAPLQRQDRQNRQGRQEQQGQRRQAAGPVLERLFELYPKLFGARFLPLKLGVFHELMERHPDDFKKDDLKLALGQHARSTRYLESVASGQARHGLDGNPVEPVAPEHVHHAVLEVFRRRQARAREDLRPQLVAQLAQAVENSGLAPEDYAARFRLQDEAANAALDEALAALALQAARREALVRAFSASGRTAAEFADMYGMKEADVAAALQRLERDRSAAANRAEQDPNQSGS